MKTEKTKVVIEDFESATGTDYGLYDESGGCVEDGFASYEEAEQYAIDNDMEVAELFFVDRYRELTEAFPNGIANFLETHYEIVSAITRRIDSDSYPKDTRLSVLYQQNGTTGLYGLAETLSRKFETENTGREWDGEWWEEIEIFCLNELDKTE